MTGQHWSIRKTARRQEQVARLGRTTGLGEDFSAVVDYALSYTIGRQETAMDEIKSIEIVVTEDALFGNATPAEEYNVKASIEAYCTDLANHLYDKYPQARIEVEAGALDSVKVNGQSDHVEVNVVKELSDRVWNVETWLVH